MTEQNVVATNRGTHGTNGASTAEAARHADQAIDRAAGSGPRTQAQGAAKGGTRARNDESTLLPPVDVFEDATGITLYTDLPGVAKDRLDVRVEADTPLIEANSGCRRPEA